MSFKTGDSVVLRGCPFDEQIPEEVQKFIKLQNIIQTVIETRLTNDTIGTTGQWIKTDFMSDDWTDSYWFTISPEVVKEPQPLSPKDLFAVLEDWVTEIQVNKLEHSMYHKIVFLGKDKTFSYAHPKASIRNEYNSFPLKIKWSDFAGMCFERRQDDSN